MTAGDRSSPEEFYSRCLSNSRVLEGASHRFAVGQDVVQAVSCAWGSDVYTAQAVVWERIMVAARVPQRRFFEVGLQLLAGLDLVHPADPATATAYDVIRASRNGILSTCDASLRRSLEEAWPDIEYLDALPAPTVEAVELNVGNRFKGMSAERYVDRKRGEAQESMAEAQSKRIKGETSAAVQDAYASDFASLEAYLVESAEAVGDPALVTVTIRWELATNSVAQLTGLPDGFVAAVSCIRQALWDGIGEADGDRLMASLIPI